MKLTTLNIDAPKEMSVGSPDKKTINTPRKTSWSLPQHDVWSSPTFIEKRVELPYLASPYNLEDDEDFPEDRPRKRTKFWRKSGQWKFSSDVPDLSTSQVVEDEVSLNANEEVVPVQEMPLVVITDAATGTSTMQSVTLQEQMMSTGLVESAIQLELRREGRNEPANGEVTQQPSEVSGVDNTNDLPILETVVVEVPILPLQLDSNAEGPLVVSSTVISTSELLRNAPTEPVPSPGPTLIPPLMPRAWSEDLQRESSPFADESTHQGPGQHGMDGTTSPRLLPEDVRDRVMAEETEDRVDQQDTQPRRMPSEVVDEAISQDTPTVSSLLTMLDPQLWDVTSASGIDEHQDTQFLSETGVMFPVEDENTDRKEEQPSDDEVIAESSRISVFEDGQDLEGDVVVGVTSSSPFETTPLDNTPYEDTPVQKQIRVDQVPSALYSQEPITTDVRYTSPLTNQLADVSTGLRDDAPILSPLSEVAQEGTDSNLATEAAMENVQTAPQSSLSPTDQPTSSPLPRELISGYTNESSSEHTFGQEMPSTQSVDAVPSQMVYENEAMEVEAMDMEEEKVPNLGNKSPRLDMNEPFESPQEAQTGRSPTGNIATSGRQPEDASPVREAVDRMSNLAKLKARKKKRLSKKRKSNVPDIISPWFASKQRSKSSEVESGAEEEIQHAMDNNVFGLLQVDDLQAADTSKEQTPQASVKSLPTNNEQHDAQTHEEAGQARQTPTDVDTSKDSGLAMGGLLTTLSYYTPLSRLEQYLNQKSSSDTHTLDIFAVVTLVTAPPSQAKAGPKDWSTIFRVTDPSVSPSGARVQVFRPYKSALPEAAVGDVILLRNFAVKSRKGQCYLLSADASAWLVWRSSGAETRQECRGPPVEIGADEHAHAVTLKRWWANAGGGKTE